MSGMNVQVGNSLNTMANKLFRKVQGVVYDLQSKGIALKNADGSVSVLDRVVTDGDGRAFALKNVPFNVTMAVPAFALHTEVDKVKAGDLAVTDKGILGFIINVGTKEGVINPAYTLLRPSGEVSTVVIPTNTMFGKEGIMVVKSFGLDGDNGIDPLMLMAMSGGLGGNGGGIDPMMFLLMGKGDSKIDPMMLMAMSGGLGGNTGGGINPMMFLLMGDGDIDPMMLMAMSGGLGNLGGNAGGNAGNSSPDTWRT